MYQFSDSRPTKCKCDEQEYKHRFVGPKATPSSYSSSYSSHHPQTHPGHTPSKVLPCGGTSAPRRAQLAFIRRGSGFLFSLTLALSVLKHNNDGGQGEFDILGRDAIHRVLATSAPPAAITSWWFTGSRHGSGLRAAQKSAPRGTGGAETLLSGP